MPLEAKIDEKTASNTEVNSVGIFNGFWLHFGGHLGGKKAPKWKPKVNEKTEAILEAFFDICGGGRRRSRGRWD